MSGRGTGHLACPCVPCRKETPTAAEPMGHFPGVPDPVPTGEYPSRGPCWRHRCGEQPGVLKGYLGGIVNAIMGSVDKCPLPMRVLFKQRCRQVEERSPLAQHNGAGGQHNPRTTTPSSELSLSLSPSRRSIASPSVGFSSFASSLPLSSPQSSSGSRSSTRSPAAATHSCCSPRCGKPERGHQRGVGALGEGW